MGEKPQLHRDGDQPVYSVREDGTQEWYINEKLRRDGTHSRKQLNNQIYLVAWNVSLPTFGDSILVGNQIEVTSRMIKSTN